MSIAYKSFVIDKNRVYTSPGLGHGITENQPPTADSEMIAPGFKRAKVLMSSPRAGQLVGILDSKEWRDTLRPLSNLSGLNPSIRLCSLRPVRRAGATTRSSTRI